VLGSAMADVVKTVVIGGGQAGLAVSHELKARDVEHVVLERNRIAQSWRGRWDSFCLVTPNWTMHLPGAPYDGDDPDGFIPRDGIVDYLVGYASSSDLPVREQIAVERLEAGSSSRFVLRTSEGDIHADSVAVCTGAYQKAHRPASASALPPDVMTIDATEYRNPTQLPPGKVLVVGSGQTGCQLSEELHLDGRDVFLACGRAPWAPRRMGDRDLVSWLTETSFMEAPLTSLPAPQARLGGNIQATGRGGGHDLHYRTLQESGVELLGHLAGIDDGTVYFEDDLAESVAFGDARYQDLRNLLNEQLPAKGLTPPALPDPPAFDADAPVELAVDELAAVIFTAGFRPDYSDWVRFPAFDDMGFPLSEDGASTAVPGLYFCGVHFLRKRKSSLLFGVGEDAAIVAASIAGDA
jgi:putative flavoprotein involved in K+ transport